MMTDRCLKRNNEPKYQERQTLLFMETVPQCDNAERYKKYEIYDKKKLNKKTPFHIKVKSISYIMHLP